MRLAVLLCVAPLVASQLLLTSPAFPNLGVIPAEYGCDATWRDDYRPSIPLEWVRAPAKAQSFVLMVEDIDNDGFIHWLVKDIPKSASSLGSDASENAMPTGSIELANSKGLDFYSGPCPTGSEEHTYRFRLYAMPQAHTHISAITDPSKLRAGDIAAQVEKDALYVAVYVGKYSVSANATTENARRGRRMELVQSELQNSTGSSEYSRSGKRPVLPGQQLPQQRFVKPSEVLKPKRPHNIILDEGACRTPELRQTPECIIYEAETAAVANGSANSTMDRHVAHATQMLVSERVKSFQEELQLWSCEEEYKRQEGVHLVSGNSETCSLRVRVTDAPCDKPMFPRQFICGGNSTNSGEFGLSPSLMWKDAPLGTQSFVLLVEESSAPPYIADYGKVFWLVTDIPPHMTSIDGGASGFGSKMPPLSIELRNTFGRVGYTAPCPGPHDVREYRLRLFAMPHAKTKLFLREGELRATEILQQLQRTALCMSSTELPFSYRASTVSHLSPLRSLPHAVSDISGELERQP